MRKFTAANFAHALRQQYEHCEKCVKIAGDHIERETKNKNVLTVTVFLLGSSGVEGNILCTSNYFYTLNYTTQHCLHFCVTIYPLYLFQFLSCCVSIFLSVAFSLSQSCCVSIFLVSLCLCVDVSLSPLPPSVSVRFLVPTVALSSSSCSAK